MKVLNLIALCVAAFVLGALVDIKIPEFFSKNMTVFDWVVVIMLFIFFFAMSVIYVFEGSRGDKHD